ncbi:MAG: metallophosphoesterase [Candidatus Micrarchaeota archaeon]|nr:metallophosphoesterase [Candidatus Micrarchaeota archaeon]
MKILIFTDLHDGIREIESILRGSDADLVCSLGDISNRQDRALARDLLDMIDYYIPGNIDGPEILSVMEPKNFHYRILRIGDVDIFGFGYSNPTPFGTYGEMSETEIQKHLSKIRLRRDTIFLTHAPPYGILDRVQGVGSVGSKAIREFVERNRDKIIMHVFGHIHEEIGSVDIHHNLKPAYMGGYAVIKDREIRLY